jgi:hypothetical protein
MGIWNGEGEVSSRVTWDRIAPHKRRIQVSKRGISKGLSARGAPSLIIANLYIRIISYMNAANKGCV